MVILYPTLVYNLLNHPCLWKWPHYAVYRNLSSAVIYFPNVGWCRRGSNKWSPTSNRDSQMSQNRVVTTIRNGWRIGDCIRSLPFNRSMWTFHPPEINPFYTKNFDTQSRLKQTQQGIYRFYFTWRIHSRKLLDPCDLLLFIDRQKVIRSPMATRFVPVSSPMQRIHERSSQSQFLCVRLFHMSSSLFLALTPSWLSDAWRSPNFGERQSDSSWRDSIVV